MKDKTSVRTQKVVITAVQASNWLSKNTDNRSLSEKTVLFLTRQIQKGKWKMTTDSIGFDSNGKLINGQHRLHAIVRANKDVEALVTYGLDPEAFNVIDTGKIRNAGDILGVAGFKTSSLVAAIVRFVVYFGTTGSTMVVKGLGKEAARMSNQEILDFAKKNRNDLEDTMTITHQVIKEFKGLPSRMVGGLYHIFSKIDKEHAQAFFMYLATGIGLTKDDPIYQLRKRLIESMTSTKKMAEKDKVALTILAWNHSRAGNKVQKLQWAADGKTSFPKPK